MSNPLEAIRYRMEHGGLTQADLALVLGSRPRASKVLGRGRVLTKDQAFKPHCTCHSPAKALIQPYYVEGP